VVVSGYGLLLEWEHMAEQVVFSLAAHPLCQWRCPLTDEFLPYNVILLDYVFLIQLASAQSIHLLYVIRCSLKSNCCRQLIFACPAFPGSDSYPCMPQVWKPLTSEANLTPHCRAAFSLPYTLHHCCRGHAHSQGRKP
jgi:hypothetical protein